MFSEHDAHSSPSLSSPSTCIVFPIMLGGCLLLLRDKGNLAPSTPPFMPPVPGQGVCPEKANHPLEHPRTALLVAPQVSCPSFIADLSAPTAAGTRAVWLVLVLPAFEAELSLAAWKEVSIQASCAVPSLAKVRDLDFTPTETGHPSLSESEGLHWGFRAVALAVGSWAQRWGMQ